MKILLTFLTVMVATVTVHAATWHVAQDGGGDFTVIQDAVDAAAPGDVIMVHAGHYTEMTTDRDVTGNGVYFVDAHVWIDKGDLTIIGDGAESTLIGMSGSPQSRTNELYGIAVPPQVASTVTISGLQFDGAYCGIRAWNESCTISDCRFSESLGAGVWLYTPDGASITGCEFQVLGSGIKASPPSMSVSIRECEFLDSSTGMVFIGTQDVEVVSCDFSGHGGGAFSVQQGAVVSIEDCEIAGSTTDNVGVYVSLGGQASLQGCTIEGFEACLWITGGGPASITADSCTFASSSFTCIWNYGGVVEVHNSTILNGGGWSVLCNYSTNSDCSIDMTNNYWGTDSQEQIEAWISDSADDPDLCCAVDFVPFQGSVATEPRNWSSVKGLFDTGGEE